MCANRFAIIIDVAVDDVDDGDSGGDGGQHREAVGKKLVAYQIRRKSSEALLHSKKMRKIVFQAKMHKSPLLVRSFVQNTFFPQVRWLDLNFFQIRAKCILRPFFRFCLATENRKSRFCRRVAFHSPTAFSRNGPTLEIKLNLLCQCWLYFSTF